VVRWRMTSLILTSFRIIQQWGTMSRRQSDVRLSAIVSVTVVQSLVRRMLGTGTMELELWDTEEIRYLEDVRKPVILQRVINRRLRPRPDSVA
jgi:hypothetical protein